MPMVEALEGETNGSECRRHGYHIYHRLRSNRGIGKAHHRGGNVRSRHLSQDSTVFVHAVEDERRAWSAGEPDWPPEEATSCRSSQPLGSDMRG